LNLKDILKSLKLNESTISMVLGAIVIIIVGILVINFFGNRNQGETPVPVGTENNEVTTFPTTHTVQKGEDLWSISEDYYGTGYNWTDIAKANGLTNPGQITEGQELTIPSVEPKTTANPTQAMEEPTATPTEVAMQEATPTEAMTATNESMTTTNTQGMEAITGNSYTVVHGDNLWNIAVRAYGDGYKWVEIARANNLANPNLIHAGNVFSIPR
jgi:nucleoid-associated protein YgaU